MTPRIRRSDLPHITLGLRRTGELIGHPCRCSRDGCTLGDHIWRSTGDMAAGPRAANLDPNSRGWRWEEETDPAGNVIAVWPVPADTTGEAAINPTGDPDHDTFLTLLHHAERAAQALEDFIQRHRPDRLVPSPDTSTQTDWCRTCLGLGRCEPRFRGDLCRWCYGFYSAYRVDPPTSLLRERHDGARITQAMVDEAVKSARRGNGRQRRRAG